MVGHKVRIYRSQLRKLLSYIQELDAKGGGVSISDLASHVGLSRRMVQRYVSDLIKLGLVNRLPGGYLSLNRDFLKHAEDSLGYTPSQVTLDDFMVVIDYADPILRLQQHVMPILRRLRAPLEMIPDLRKNLVLTTPEKLRLSKNLVGPRVLQPDFVHDSIITTSIVGIAGAGKMTLFRLDSFGAICVYIACASAASWSGAIEKGDKMEEFLPLFRPDIRRIRESNLPFRELFTEFPALRKVGYGLVLHYLTELTVYKLCIEAIEKFGKEIELIFRLGSLIPHGFFSGLSERDAAFRRLKFEFLETFTSFCNLARNLEITPVGVVIDPRDRWFSNNVCKRLMKIDEDVEFRDHFILGMVMQERDSTCLIQREEVGKNLKDFFEFYLKNQQVTTKYEFVNLNKRDPLELQKRIADVAYNTASPYPYRFIRAPLDFGGTWREREQLMAPFVSHEASYNATLHLTKIMKYLKIAIGYGLEKFWEEMYDERTRSSSL